MDVNCVPVSIADAAWQEGTHLSGGFTCRQKQEGGINTRATMETLFPHKEDSEIEVYFPFYMNICPKEILLYYWED